MRMVWTALEYSCNNTIEGKKYFTLLAQERFRKDLSNNTESSNRIIKFSIAKQHCFFSF